MSEISPIARPGPTGPGLLPSERLNRTDAVSAPTRESDQVELSDLAQLVSKYRALPDVRQELVDKVRSEIAAGTYDTPDKVDALLDDLIDDLQD